MTSRFAALAVLLLVAAPARAEEPAKIRDNLFLLEEAYNQEPGVIQHIQVFEGGAAGWTYSFTEEWPVPGDRHQLSVTLPLLHQDGGKAAELSDMLVNYRLQALGIGGKGPIAIAPRVSLVLPTGDWRTGGGRGALGIQTNLPVSIDLHRYFVLHLNAGFTLTPSAQTAAGERTTFDSAVGAAFVWLPLEWVNGLVEVAHLTTEDAGGSATGREAQFVINPGVRFAIDFDFGLQIVPGLSMPLRFGGGDRPEISGLAYLSFEHALWEPK